MTDEEILKVVNAHKDGKDIQRRNKRYDGEWEDVATPTWDFDSYEYRTKPEYVPYDSVDEIDRGKMVRRKNNSEDVIRQIVAFDRKRNRVIPFIGEYFIWLTLKEMFDSWEYEDGTTFGKLVSE